MSFSSAVVSELIVGNHPMPPSGYTSLEQYRNMVSKPAHPTTDSPHLKGPGSIVELLGLFVVASDAH